jgi:transposase IS66 family protein
MSLFWRTKLMSTLRPKPLVLGNFEGLLQTDDYAAYDRVGGSKIVHAACWAYARRRFVEAVKLNQQDVASLRIVALMDRLFAVDAQARDEKMDHAARPVAPGTLLRTLRPKLLSSHPPMGRGLRQGYCVGPSLCRVRQHFVWYTRIRDE